MRTDFASWVSLPLCLIPTYSPHQLSDTAAGLHFLHSHNIVHGGLKGVRDRLKSRFMTILTYVKSNVLVDATICARITDFGLVDITQNLDSILKTSGRNGYATRWTAPEIMSEDASFSKEADVFSFAMVMIEVHREWVILVEL